MTRFERDYNGIKNGTEDAIIILQRRKEELKSLEEKGRREKNSFRRECIAQDFVKRTEEYNLLSELA